MLGTSWLLLTGTWLETAGGPLNLIVAFALCIIIELPFAFAYMEAIPMLPLAGGEVVYSAAAFGSRGGFVVGWAGVLMNAIDPQTGHIRRSGVVPVGVKPVGIFKMAVCHAQLPGLLIHLFHKGLHISAAVSGKGKGRVVSGVEQQAIKKRLHGDRSFTRET